MIAWRATSPPAHATASRPTTGEACSRMSEGTWRARISRSGIWRGDLVGRRVLEVRNRRRELLQLPGAASKRRGAGIGQLDVMSVANNHAFDFGEAGRTRPSPP